MTINTQKLLPASKKSEIVKSKENFIIPYEKTFSSRKTNVKRDNVSKKKNILGDYKEDLIEIKNTLVNIDKLLKSSFTTKKKFEDKKRKQKENVEFKQREDKLEEKKPKGINLPAPIKGVVGNIFDRFIRFIFFTALGWLVPKIIEFLPVIMGILKVLGSVYKFFEDIFGKLLDTLAGFLEFGFKVQDSIRGAVKAIGGEGAAKIFDNFNGVLSTLVNTLIITGMLFSTGIFDIAKDLLGKQDCCCPGFGLEDILPDDKPDKKPKTPKKQRITGDRPRGPLDKIRRRFDKINPFRQKPKITGDAPRGPLDKIRRRFDKINPFRQKPKITGDTPGGKGFFTGIQEGFGKAFKWMKGFGEGASEIYKKTIGALSSRVDDLLKKGKGKIWKWLSEQPGVLGKVAKAAPDLLKRLGKYLPFVGDLAQFIFDIIGGIDWRRALIRTLTGVGIDAGFTALMAALGLATPFTGGASGALATAIYLSYMSADFASGGFGVRLGDKIADFLKLPMKAGEKGGDAPPPGRVGTEADVKKVQAEIEKKKKEDPEFVARIAGQKTEVKQPEQKPKDGETQATAIGGLILPQQQEEKKTLSDVPSGTRGGKNVDGEVTRGGKTVGGSIGRTLKVAKERIQKPLIERLEDVVPGRDTIGGEKGIIKLYGGSKKDDKKKNGFKVLLKSSSIFKDIPFGIGSIMGSAIDAVLGQKPIEDVSKGLSEGLSYIINGISSGFPIENLMGEIFRFSDGGSVPSSSLAMEFSENKITPDLISNIIGPPIDQKINEVLKLVNEHGSKRTRSSEEKNQLKKQQNNLPSNDTGETSISPQVTGKKADLWKQFKGYGATAGAKYPQLVSAQFALESSWGSKLSGTHNYFGIKASPGESATEHKTREVYGGKSVYINAPFKNFNSPQDSVNHLVTQWYKNYKGYTGVNNAANAEDAAKQLKKQGYATDPGYASSLIKLLKENASLSGGGSFPTNKNKKTKGQWFSGPMSGYPAILNGDEIPSFFGHGLEWAGFSNNRDSGYVIPFDTPKTKKNPNITKEKFKEAKTQGYSLPSLPHENFGSISDDLITWAKANKEMIEKVGTKKQKEILEKVEMQENIQNLFKNKDTQPVQKMISGGRISGKKPTIPKINNFTSYNNPQNRKSSVYIQPYYIQMPERPVAKTMGYPFVGNSQPNINERSLGLLRN